jgi:hypothetical protein
MPTAIRQAAALHSATIGHPKVLGAEWLHGREGLVAEIGGPTIKATC